MNSPNAVTGVFQLFALRMVPPPHPPFLALCLSLAVIQKKNYPQHDDLL